MANVERVIRVPNLPIGRLVDENGMPTDDFLTFLQGLITSLQLNFGSEGLVMPTQNPTDLITIQDNVNISEQYTCALGTLIYERDPLDYTQDKVKVAFRDSNTYPDATGVEPPPIFKTITVT